MKTKTVVLASFNEVDPARRLQERLQQARLKSLIHNESKLERFWFMSEPLASVHVEVNQPDYLTAHRLVEEWDRTEGILREAVKCPECGSSRVEFPQVTRKFVMPAMEAVLMALHILPRKFYCSDCHFTWPKEKQLQTERDVLGWPAKSKLWHPGEVKKQKQA
jgi:ribosomal protein S27AE